MDDLKVVKLKTHIFYRLLKSEKESLKGFLAKIGVAWPNRPQAEETLADTASEAGDASEVGDDESVAGDSVADDSVADESVADEPVADAEDGSSESSGSKE